MISQRQSVFGAVIAVLKLDNDFKGTVELTKEQRSEVIEMVTDGITGGTVEFSDKAKAKYSTREKVHGYVGGMVSNWLRKDTRLNGGEKYETKNPGSRAGQGDEVLKNLKALLAQQTTDANKSAVNTEIEKRQAELKAAKAKTITVDASKIPDELKHLIPQA